MQTGIEQAERREIRFFLVNHGRYYAKEILTGCVFAPMDRTAESELIREIRAGDIVFHAFGRGIAAVGRAIRPCRVLPYPAWRYADGFVGARGYLLDTEDRLLKEPIETDLLSERYLISLSREQAKRVFDDIFGRFPEVADFFRAEKEIFSSDSVEIP